MQFNTFETGVLEAGEGPLAILVHGIYETKEVWVPFMQMSHNAHTVAYDNRMPTKTYTTSISKLAQDLHEVVSRIAHHKPYYLIGHSFGCTIIQKFLLDGMDTSGFQMPLHTLLLNGAVKSPAFLKNTPQETHRAIINSMIKQSTISIFDPLSFFLGNGAPLPPELIRTAIGQIPLQYPAEYDAFVKNINYDYTEEGKRLRGHKVTVIGSVFDEIISRDEVTKLSETVSGKEPQFMPADHMSIWSPQISQATPPLA